VLSKKEAFEAGKKWCEEKGVAVRSLGYAGATAGELLRALQGTAR
jgi:hypothetical protein